MTALTLIKVILLSLIFLCESKKATTLLNSHSIYKQHNPIVSLRAGFLLNSGLNSTLGHSDPSWALGLKGGSSSYASYQSKSSEENDQNQQPIHHHIQQNEITEALEEALELSELSTEDLLAKGYTLVDTNEMFKLYKRRNEGSKMSEYVMIGHLEDVSPRTFLEAQVDQPLRELWDTSMDSMKIIKSRFYSNMNKNKLFNHNHNSNNNNNNNDINSAGLSLGDENASDVIYYRTKWPWPLKNRDYILARRCKEYLAPTPPPSSSSLIKTLPPALVFMSRSVDMTGETGDVPVPAGSVRVDNYWCRSSFISTRKDKVREILNSISSTPTVNNNNKGGSCNNNNNKNPFNRFQQNLRTNNNNNNGGNVGGRDDNKLSQEQNYIDSISQDKLSEILDLPGTIFVTRFCDDCKVPLPNYMIDIIAKHAEKEVPSGMQRLRQVCKDRDSISGGGGGH